MYSHRVHTLVVNFLGAVMFADVVRLRVRRDNRECFALYFFFRPPKDPLGAIAPHQDAVFHIQSNDGYRRGLNNCFKHLLRLPPSPLYRTIDGLAF